MIDRVSPETFDHLNLEGTEGEPAWLSDAVGHSSPSSLPNL